MATRIEELSFFIYSQNSSFFVELQFFVNTLKHVQQSEEKHMDLKRKHTELTLAACELVAAADMMTEMPIIMEVHNWMSTL
jgi:hypothetical protein